MKVELTESLLRTLLNEYDNKDEAEIIWDLFRQGMLTNARLEGETVKFCFAAPCSSHQAAGAIYTIA